MVFKLNKTGSVLNRSERLNFNENWDKLEKVISDRGLEILSESGFLTWLEENGIKHRGEVQSFDDLPSNDSLNTVRGVVDNNKIYIKKENGWLPFQSIDISKINLVERKVEDITVNIRNFGAVGDGETNDRASILAAKEEAIRLDAELYIPSGDFYVVGDLDLSGLRFINALGSITFANSTNKITISYDSTKANSKVYRLGDVFVGYVEILGLKNAEFHVAYTRHLRLFADSNDSKISSIAYNSFYPGRIDLVEYDSLNYGWINENKWFGGRIIEVLIDGNYHHNHNIFYGPTMERTGKPAKININKGNSNKFYNVRWENPDDTNQVIFGEGTWDNTVERSWTGAPHGYQQGSYKIFNVIDNGAGNAVINDMDKYRTFEEVFSVSKNSGNFNSDWVNIGQDNLEVIFNGVYSRFFETGLFEATEDFSFEYFSDASIWRTSVFLYDANKDRITDEAIARSALNSVTMNWNVNSNAFTTAVNRNRSSFSFKSISNVKYIEISVTAQSQGPFEFIKIYTQRQNSKRMTIPYLPILNVLRGSKPPNSNSFPNGTICWNTSDSDGSVIGWKLSAGLWKPFGELNVSFKAKSGTYTDSGTGTKSFWTIPHGLGEIPKRFGVIPANSETGDMRVKYVNATPANLVVFLSGSVPTGEGNVQIHWWVEA